MPELMPSKNGEVAKFQQALQTQRIAQLDTEPLKQALRYAMVLVGIKAHNVPNDREKTVLIQFIQKNYGGHTPDEIRLAFDLAVSGELDVEDVKCYENFSPLYFASIMNAYRIWARHKHKELKPKPNEMTADEKINIELEYAAYLQKQVDKWPSKIRP
jgi:hypothetical protein